MSGRQGESDGRAAGKSKGARKVKDGPREKGARKQRSADLGRALRTVYDDTLREAVPDDFLNLLGKLS